MTFFSEVFILDSTTMPVLSLCVLTLIITVLLFRVSGKSRTTVLLAGFFAMATAFLVAGLMSMSTYRMEWCSFQYLFLLAGLGCLLQFAYHFPQTSATYVREANGVLAGSIMAVLIEVWLSIEYVRTSGGYPAFLKVNRVGALLVTLEVCGVCLIFFRRTLHLTAQALAQQSHSPITRASRGFRGWFALLCVALLHPPGKHAQATRALLVVLVLFPLIAGWAAVFQSVLLPQHLISTITYLLILNQSMLLSLFAFVMVYLNYMPETTTFMNKLILSTLMVVLSLFGMFSQITLSAVETDYQRARQADLQQALSLLFLDERSDQRSPDTAPAVVAFVISHSLTEDSQGAAYTEHLVRDPQFTVQTLHETLLRLRLPFIRAGLRGERVYAVQRFIQGGREYLVGFPTSLYLDAINPHAMPLLYMLLGSTFVVIVMFPLFFRKSLINPLENLLAGVRAVNQGNLEVSMPIRYHDEIGFLTTSFNGMVVQLHDLVTNLEQRVAERTQQLEQQNIELVQARNAADVANQAKSAFLANMTHELRSPLNAILGFAQLMVRSKRLDQENLENLSIVMRSGEHLLTLINQVLDLSKIEAGKMTLNPRPFDLGRLLDDVEDMFRLKAEDKQLQLAFQRGDNVPRNLSTDELKLRQVIINLLNNALKFTQTGGVTVRVTKTFEVSETSKVSLRFEVEDTGAGIAPEELSTLFEAFEQTSSGKQAQEGTGLGLPISRRFVQLMGGDMAVRSQVGVGTTFRFEIDAERLAEDVSAAAPKAHHVIALEPGQPRYRVLIVDDKPNNRLLLVKLLSPLGFELREAENGQEALQIWESWEPHVIWMDMRMPVLDGYEATKRIKATTKGQATVIIALTASMMEEERAVTLSAGCDDFLRKPFREADIFTLMTKHLGVRFVYEEETPVEVTPKTTELPALLAQVPADLREQLRHAVAHSDMDLIDRVIGDIRTYQPSAADILTEWANNFQYEHILSVL